MLFTKTLGHIFDILQPVENIEKMVTLVYLHVKDLKSSTTKILKSDKLDLLKKTYINIKCYICLKN